MKKCLLLFLVILLSNTAFGQYKISYEKASEFERNGKFYDAIQMYNTASSAWDKPVNNDLNKRIIFCTEQLNQTLKQAKANEQKARYSEKLASENARKAELNLSEVLKSQGDQASNECAWGDALLYYQKAYEKYPDNSSIDASAKNALNKFVPEVAIFRHPYKINDMSFSPTGKYLITASGNTIQVLNLETYEYEYVLRGFSEEVVALAFSKDPNILMSYSEDHTIRFWNLKDGNEIGKWRHFYYGDNILSKIAFDVDQNFYIMADGNNIYIKSLEDNKLLALIQGHKQKITSFSYSPEKHLIVSCAADENEESIRLNDISDINIGEVRFLKSFASKVENIEIQSKGDYLVYKSEIGLGSIGIYDIRNNIISNVISEKGMAGTFALNSKENLFSYLYNDNKNYPIYLYDLTNLSAQKKRAKLDSHTNVSVTMCAFSQNGEFLASIDVAGYVRLWNLKTATINKFKHDLSDACNVGLSYILDSIGNFVSKDLDSLLLDRKGSNTNWLSDAIKNQTNMFIGDESPLMKYIHKGPYDKAKNLITQGTGLSFRNESGYTPLMYAITLNKPEIINPLKKCNFLEDFLFVVALNDTKIIKRFLENGADVNYTNPYGETALHIAVANGNFDIVKLLVEKYSANINAQTIKNTTPLLIALQNDQENIANYILSRNPVLNVKEEEWGLTEIHHATLRGYSEIVKKLIEKKVNLNEQDNDGYTALVYAANNSSNEILKLLLEAGANKALVDPQYKATPLLTAVSNGNLEGCKLLLEAGASVNTCNKYYLSPLEVAASNGFVDIAKLLVKYDADVKHEDINNRSAIDYAKEKQYKDIIDLLAKHNAVCKTTFQFNKCVQFRGRAVNYGSYGDDGCVMTITKTDSIHYSCEIKYDGNRLVGIFKSIKGVENTNTDNTTASNRIFQFEGYEYTGIKGDKSTYLSGTNAKCTIQIAITPKGQCKGVYHLGLVADQTVEQYGTFDLRLINSK
jgi:ankyrin repeat protein